MVHPSQPMHQVHSRSFKLPKNDQIFVQSILDHFTLCREILVVVKVPLKSHG